MNNVEGARSPRYLSWYNRRRRPLLPIERKQKGGIFGRGKKQYKISAHKKKNAPSPQRKRQNAGKNHEIPKETDAEQHGGGNVTEPGDDSGGKRRANKAGRLPVYRAPRAGEGRGKEKYGPRSVPAPARKKKKKAFAGGITDPVGRITAKQPQDSRLRKATSRIPRSVEHPAGEMELPGDVLGRRVNHSQNACGGSCASTNENAYNQLSKMTRGERVSARRRQKRDSKVNQVRAQGPIFFWKSGVHWAHAQYAGGW